ncbi:hypothetical protein ABT147_38840 [Streptomyces sp. NPDC001868]|uniref:hypothetical protein n=1 Tax=Streptomyces sp. NPDC001868 TaxID=3154401 RepID=UPI00332D577A
MKQLHAADCRFLPKLAAHTPLLPGADQVAYVDIVENDPPHLRLRQAGGRLRVQQGQEPER